MKKKLFILFSLLLLLITGCNTLQVNRCTPFYAMDTVIQVTFYNTSDYDKHYNEIKNIYNYYDKLSSSFSSSEDYSIYDLNQKRSINAKPELVSLINYSLHIEESTNGYFNIFLGKLNNYWKSFINDEINEYDQNIVASLLAEGKETSLTISNNTITINGNGDIDLGGIAKGYATKMAEEYLKEKGVTGYLINAGDSNISLGTKGGDAFNIGLAKPYSDGLYLTLELSNCAIGTSSPKYQYKEYNGIKYHHIINPYTGYSEAYYDSVSVFGLDSALVDCYSTALFSMALEEAKEFINTNNIKAVLYKDNSIIYRSIDL